MAFYNFIRFNNVIQKAMLIYIEKFIVCIVTFVLQFFHVEGSWKCSNNFVGAVLRPKILDNTLGILT